MQALMDKDGVGWDECANLPSRPPPELRQRHAEIYAKAMAIAREKGWDPERGEDD